MHLNISEKQSNRMLSITQVLNHEQMCLTFITVLNNIAVRLLLIGVDVSAARAPLSYLVKCLFFI